MKSNHTFKSSSKGVRKVPNTKEKSFCYYYHHLRNGKEAAVRAGYPPDSAEKKANCLLQKEEIQFQIAEYDKEFQREKLRNDVIAALRRFAFGPVEDGVKLMMNGEQETEILDALDLFSVTDVKRSKDGITEVKFADRFKALEHLMELCGGVDSKDDAAALYRALEQGAGTVEKTEGDA